MIVLDQRQYDALIKVYMEAGVPKLVVPQDNILFACLYQEIVQSRFLISSVEETLTWGVFYRMEIPTAPWI